jgi:hypothetical protein
MPAGGRRRGPLLLAALAIGTWAAFALLRRYRRGGARLSTELDVDRGELEGVAAELALRGIAVEVERALDLTVDPGVERYLLRYPEREERRVQRHLAVLLAARRRHLP